MTPPAVGYGNSEPSSSTRSSSYTDRSPSPSSPTYRRAHVARRRLNMSSRVRHLLTPRILTPLLLWSVSLWLVHRYLYALPLPSWKTLSPEDTTVRVESLFPPTPDRQGEDSLDSLDPRYRPFAPIPPPSPFPRLRPTRFLPKHCMESWFMDGEITCTPEELGEEDTLDATWLWVNGSDSRWAGEMATWRKVHNVYSPERHFREQNELKYSMRSVVKALEGHIRTCHLILYDYAFDVQRDVDLLPQSTIDLLEDEMKHHRADRSSAERYNGTSETEISNALASHLSENWRVSQTPTWLDFSKLDPNSPDHPAEQSPHNESETQWRGEVKYPQLRYAAHSEIFHLPTRDRADIDDAGETEWREKEWRKKALPSYNSMAIESRIGWLPGLADVALALNDDFFILRPHAVSDFHSPLYGNVVRFDWGWFQQVRPVLEEARFNDAGELGGLWHANYLLSQRFPHRLRPYFAHAPKIITRSLHHEASIMFQEALTISGSRRFREVKFGEGDVQMQWLLTALRVERWREALLWTWAVANLGGANGQWGDDSRAAIKNLFELGKGDEDVVQIEVHRGERKTLQSMKETFGKAGWAAPKATDFKFSSMDGHIPRILKPGSNENLNDWCNLDLQHCFGPFWDQTDASIPADEMFKRLTFQHPECGDCMIMALVTASGPKGLSAFFPAEDATFVNPSTNPSPSFVPVAHLPLTPTWQEADFSMSRVLATTSMPGEAVNLREYTMHLLSRYQYSHGKSVSHFHMLKDPNHALKVFNDMLDKNPKVSILGLNDDIERGYEEVRKIMNRWFESRWPEKNVWERGWSEDQE
ncbi:Xanthine phosphoribosyltransferase 1 [Apiotrichum porosum]|uniref:Xanthine phosphoribosyltransferase 1 n=1 Tax=Apiotrichum porosum TaxID=105984 RepID=A0A427XMK3_9TREE|nr:Xanthine phosphoribosyltransferase 1 [Apiotrichum porosum]RSH79984.1 Xanthine phosphoribosyltransferase 1 [Apiotrichum porosum]